MRETRSSNSAFSEARVRGWCLLLGLVNVDKLVQSPFTAGAVDEAHFKHAQC